MTKDSGYFSLLTKVDQHFVTIKTWNIIHDSLIQPAVKFGHIFFFNLECKMWMLLKILYYSILNSYKIWSSLFFLILIRHIIQDLEYSNCPIFLGILETFLNLISLLSHYLLPPPSLSACITIEYFAQKTIQSIEDN